MASTIHTTRETAIAGRVRRGLRGIERRLAPFDGVLAISSPPGGPTAVTMEIAARLVITERAVAKHTASIFIKLDLQPSDDDNRRVLAVLAYLGG